MLTGTVALLMETLAAPAAGLKVPVAQEFNGEGAVSTSRPDGKLSVTPTPLKATTFADGLVIETVSVDVSFSRMSVGEKLLAIIGGATTVIEAVAVGVLPVSDVESVVVLFLIPAVVPVTFTEKVQFAPAARTAFVKLIVPVSDVAVIVPPPHEPVRLFGLATTKPAGRLSVKLTLLSGNAALLLVIVKLKLVEELSGIEGAPKDFVNDGAAITLSVAVLLAAPAPLSSELIASVVLFFAPSLVPVTLTAIVQLAFAESEPLAKVIEPDPAAAVTVPLQLLTTFGVAATVIPEGRLSVKAICESDCDGFGLVIVKVKLVEPLTLINDAPNALPIEAG